MPMYEFVCRDCGAEFEELCTLSDVEAKRVPCPECEGTEVERRVSTFASSVEGGGGGGCGHAHGGFG